MNCLCGVWIFSLNHLTEIKQQRAFCSLTCLARSPDLWVNVPPVLRDCKLREFQMPKIKLEPKHFGWLRLSGMKNEFMRRFRAKKKCCWSWFILGELEGWWEMAWQGVLSTSALPASVQSKHCWKMLNFPVCSFLKLLWEKENNAYLCAWD